MFKIGQCDNLSDLSTCGDMIFIAGLSSSLLVKKQGDAIDPTMLDYGMTSGTITNDKLYFSNLEHEIHEMDLNTKQTTKIDEHEYLVSQMLNSPYGLITMGLDKKIRLDSGKQSIYLEEAPLRMALKDNKLEVALMDKSRVTYDVRHFDKPIDTSMVGLKYMIRDMIYHREDIAYSSIEGRVQCSESFAFKCHRKKVEGKEYIYPVHALASSNNLLITGGADGEVAFWDVDKKKRSKITAIGGSIYRMKNFGDELVIGTEEGNVVTLPL